MRSLRAGQVAYLPSYYGGNSWETVLSVRKDGDGVAVRWTERGHTRFWHWRPSSEVQQVYVSVEEERSL